MAIEQTTVSKKDALNSNNALKTNCNLSTSKFHQKQTKSRPVVLKLETKSHIIREDYSPCSPFTTGGTSAHTLLNFHHCHQPPYLCNITLAHTKLRDMLHLHHFTLS